MDINTSGIYTITSLDGKQYIGSAKNFEYRFRKHLTELRHNKHHNRNLRSAFKKYGECGLTFKPIIYCEQKDLIFYEQLAIDAMRPAHNICLFAGSGFGTKLSQEAKNKIAAAQTGRNHTPESKFKMSIAKLGGKLSIDTRLKMSHSAIGKRVGKKNPMSVAIICAETGQLFDSISCAVRWIRSNTQYSKATHANIAKVCKGNVRYKTAYGYHWKYADEK